MYRTEMGPGGAWTKTKVKGRLNKSFQKRECTRFGGYLDGGVEGMEASA